MKLRSLKYLSFEGLKNIWVNRLMSLASIGVLVACMILMGAAVLFSVNVDKALGSLQDQNVAMVYMEDSTTEAQAKNTLQKIANLTNIKKADFVSKEDGMNSLLDDLGDQYNALFEWVDDENGSFLPYGVRVSFEDLEQYDSTIAAIKKIDNVDSINDSRDLTIKIMSIRQTVTFAGVWIIGLLLITALVIIANTIRITMHSRKLEISIMKAVGATNNFVRFPFIVEGMFFGVISAAFSMVILFFAYRMTLRQLTDIMTVDAVPFTSTMWYLFGGFVVIGIVAGCIGSIISINKYLKKEGSELLAL